LPIAVETIRILVGCSFMVFGVGLVASSRARFLRTGQKPAPWTPTPTLILDGPYRLTRNPMYVGVTLLQIGIGVTSNNGWIALLALVALMLVHFVAVRPEERYLSDKFGEPYRRYLREVRRYL
jgi:protein-S-isoprenylcysteine O-methyltransferase Ste14